MSGKLLMVKLESRRPAFLLLLCSSLERKVFRLICNENVYMHMHGLCVTGSYLEKTLNCFLLQSLRQVTVIFCMIEDINVTVIGCPAVFPKQMINFAL